MLRQAVLAVLAVSPSAGFAATGFCQRLATEIGMKPAKQPGVWEVQTRSAGMLLFGGSTTFSIKVAPIGTPTLVDYQNATKACSANRKGAVCALSGPAEFRLTFKNKDVRVPIEPGEEADVAIVGTRIRCEDRKTPDK